MRFSASTIQATRETARTLFHFCTQKINGRKGMRPARSDALSVQSGRKMSAASLRAIVGAISSRGIRPDVPLVHTDLKRVWYQVSGTYLGTVHMRLRSTRTRARNWAASLRA